MKSASLAKRRRGEPVMAPERLRELGGLAVADPVCDLADGEAAGGQELRRALHANRREVLAERRVADLGVRALKLASRRRDASSDVVERQVGAVLGLDDGYGITKQARAVANRGGSLNGDFHAP